VKSSPTEDVPPFELIGYWSAGDDSLPDPVDWVDTNWRDDEKDQILSFLHRGVLYRAYMGYSRCRICGVNNGSLEFTDLKYAWPEGLAHYISEHDVHLPEAITNAILDRWEAIQSNGGQLDGWLEQTAKDA
jgi:hypothetical protein